MRLLLAAGTLARIVVREYLQYTIKSLFRYSSSNAYRVLDLSDLSELLCEPVFRAFTSTHCTTAPLTNPHHVCRF